VLAKPLLTQRGRLPLFALDEDGLPGSPATVLGIAGQASHPSRVSRQHHVDGTFNFRDAGGVQTTSGHRMTTGRVFRSASLASITGEGLSTIADLGIRTVIDLRSVQEVEQHGRFPDDRYPVRWEHLASPFGPPGSLPLTPQQQSIIDHPDPMALLYVQLMRSMGGEFARCLRILSNPANLPAVVHCTSGKDRTGLVTAILHLTLGCPLEVALSHYEQTGGRTESDDHLRANFPLLYDLPPEKLERMVGTNRSWVVAALAVSQEWGGLAGWLDEHGFDVHHQNRLRAGLLLPS